jgi:hypothetical protein
VRQPRLDAEFDEPQPLFAYGYVDLTSEHDIQPVSDPPKQTVDLHEEKDMLFVIVMEVADYDASGSLVRLTDVCDPGNIQAISRQLCLCVDRLHQVCRVLLCFCFRDTSHCRHAGTLGETLWLVGWFCCSWTTCMGTSSPLTSCHSAQSGSSSITALQSALGQVRCSIR